MTKYKVTVSRLDGTFSSFLVKSNTKSEAYELGKSYSGKGEIITGVKEEFGTETKKELIIR